LAISFIGLEIAARSSENRRSDAASRRSVDKIANRMLAFSRSALLHVD
jgi:hypothetical protein